jgi:mono/diheme cytochrome c family protein
VEDQKKKAAAKLDDPAKVWTLDDMLKRGEKVYAANCAACHQANGKGAGPSSLWMAPPSCWTPTMPSRSRFAQGQPTAPCPPGSN